MSVGGRVVMTKTEEERVLIDTGEAAIYVQKTPAARSVSPGDTVWWHGRKAYWTPKGRPFTDYPLKRIGYSFAGSSP